MSGLDNFERSQSTRCSRLKTPIEEIAAICPSEKHIDRYLDVMEWSFNNRENPYLFRDTLAKLLGSSNLEYKELVAA